MNKQKREKKRRLQKVGEPEWIERRSRQYEEEMLGPPAERRRRHAEKEKRRRQQVEWAKQYKSKCPCEESNHGHQVISLTHCHCVTRAELKNYCLKGNCFGEGSRLAFWRTVRCDTKAVLFVNYV
jgi:hypothetical protein